MSNSVIHYLQMSNGFIRKIQHFTTIYSYHIFLSHHICVGGGILGISETDKINILAVKERH